jgi:hypothetical protein
MNLGPIRKEGPLHQILIGAWVTPTQGCSQALQEMFSGNHVMPPSDQQA